METIDFCMRTAHLLPTIKDDSRFTVCGAFNVLRQPDDRRPAPGEDGFVDEESSAAEPGWDEKLLCRECGQMITSPAERTAVQGSCEHTFANPAGILYQIGCFRTVRGCSYVGPATQEWSWFQGYSWRVAVCSRCLTHMGWRYQSFHAPEFHGLILSRLVQAGMR